MSMIKITRVKKIQARVRLAVKIVFLKKNTKYGLTNYL